MSSLSGERARLRIINQLVLILAFAAGIAALVWASPRLALIPVGALFGWLQITGL